MMTNVLPIEIPDRNIKMYLPLSLDAMDQRQYVAFFGLLFQLENKEIDFYDFSIHCIYELLGLKKGKRKLEADEVENALSNIAQLAEYISEYFDRQENTLSLKLEYTRNHIEFVELPFFKKYYGPVQHYHDVKFGEYEDGLNIFLQYNETPSRELLQQLMATFYRQKNSTGRADYHQPDVKDQAQKFSQLSKGTLYGFYYNFAAFHTYFSSSQVYYSGQIIDLSILFTDPDGEKDTYTSPFPSLGIKSTGIEIAKTGVLGNLQEVRNTPLWE